MSKIMFGMRSKIKELVKLVKLNSNCSKSQLNSDIFFKLNILKTIFVKSLSQLEKYSDIY